MGPGAAVKYGPSFTLSLTVDFRIIVMGSYWAVCNGGEAGPYCGIVGRV